MRERKCDDESIFFHLYATIVAMSMMPRYCFEQHLILPFFRLLLSVTTKWYDPNIPIHCRQPDMFAFFIDHASLSLYQWIQKISWFSLFPSFVTISKHVYLLAMQREKMPTKKIKSMKIHSFWLGLLSKLWHKRSCEYTFFPRFIFVLNQLRYRLWVKSCSITFNELHCRCCRPIDNKSDWVNGCLYS